MKGYGGLPQTPGQVLFDGALLTVRGGASAPVAMTRIVPAGAAWSADVAGGWPAIAVAVVIPIVVDGALIVRSAPKPD